MGFDGIYPPVMTDIAKYMVCIWRIYGSHPVMVDIPSCNDSQFANVKMAQSKIVSLPIESCDFP